MKSCAEITELMEKAKFKRLSFKDRLELSMHAKICAACKRYKVDSELIDQLVAKRANKLSRYVFTQEEKEAMIQRMKSLEF